VFPKLFNQPLRHERRITVTIEQSYDKVSSGIPGATDSQTEELTTEICVTGRQYDIAAMHVDTSLTRFVCVPVHDEWPTAQLLEQEILHTSEGPHFS
jgi:hypothetical protein